MAFDFETKPQAPAGMHLGVLFQMIELGTQTYQAKGQPPTPSPKLLLNFELPNKLMADGRPFAVSAKYSTRVGETSNLHKNIKSWTEESISKSYDFKKLLGKSALVNITHNDNGYASVSTIHALLDGQAPVKATNPLTYFDLEMCSQENLAKLDEYIQKQIKASPEYLLMQKHGCSLKEARIKEQEARNKLNPNAGHPAFDDGTPVE